MECLVEDEMKSLYLTHFHLPSKIDPMDLQSE